jgi:hypothetical protein
MIPSDVNLSVWTLDGGGGGSGRLWMSHISSKIFRSLHAFVYSEPILASAADAFVACWIWNVFGQKNGAPLLCFELPLHLAIR